MELERFLELMDRYDFMVIKHRNNGLWPIEVENPLEVFNKYGDDVSLYKQENLKVG